MFAKLQGEGVARRGSGLVFGDDADDVGGGAIETVVFAGHFDVLIKSSLSVERKIARAMGSVDEIDMVDGFSQLTSFRHGRRTD